jgi:diguanylate cyclase (GGDEF)-like protein
MRSLRIALIAGFVLLVLQIGVVVALGTSPHGSFVSNLIQLGLGILVVIASLRAAHRSEALGRHIWRLVALAYALWGVAQALSTYGDAFSSGLVDWLVNLLFCFWFVPIGMALFLESDSEPAEFDWLVATDCIQAFLFWIAAYVYFFLIPSRFEGMIALAPSVLSLYFVYYGVLTLAFFVRTLLSAAGVARALFGRMGLLLLLSGLVDAYYNYGPGKNLATGTWFDLLWSGMLLIPLLMAATWKQPKISVQPASSGIHRRVITHLFSLIYPLLILVMSVRIAAERLSLAATVIFVSFICFSLRTLIIQHRLLKTQEAYRHEATHDGLTSIWNRMTILDILQRELLRAEREGSSVGIIMADIDHFKLVNDSMGHVSGDVVLRSVASEIALALRPYDSVGRYGGEEFLIVAPVCDLAQTRDLAERVREGIENRTIMVKDKRARITLSMGVAAGSFAMVTESLLHAADTALYAAKSNGRNRVEPQADRPGQRKGHVISGTSR